jgi:radical SAM protein with 4Fe4S-binding SPASM domain
MMIALSSQYSTKAVREIRDYVPRNILLQWHVTERCNGRCIHCYQDGFSGNNDLDFAALNRILDQFMELLDECDHVSGKGKTRAHVTVTGGEPFQREDLLDLLDLLAARRKSISLAILTNGVMIDERLASYLGFLRPRFVQVSLEGGIETHDRIRGAGNSDRVIAGVRNLVRHHVPTILSFTAHRENFREFPEVAKRGLELGVNMVWADRFVPIGQGEARKDLVLSTAETQEFVRLVSAARPKGFPLARRRTEVAGRRALQFLHSGERPYACTAGSTLLTIMTNGDLVPCRRMPIVIGNLLNNRLCDLYWKNERLRAMRRRDQPIAGCEACRHRDRCRGGLRCLSYAVYGDSSRADPGCWLAKR